MNIYNKLVTVKIPPELESRSGIQVDMPTHYAALVDSEPEIEELFNQAKEEDIEVVDKIIRRVLNSQQLRLKSTALLDLKMFIGIRDFIIESDAKHAKSEKEIERLTKTAYPNIQYYESLLGYFYECDYEDEYLLNVRRDLSKLRRLKIIELHKLEKITNQIIRGKDNLEYNRDMGLLYTGEVESNDRLMLACTLGRLDESYTKTKIVVLNKEICFLKKNIKYITFMLRARHGSRSLENNKYKEEI